MKLTDEMRAAISGELMGYEPDQLDIGIFLAGYRMGQRDMRERAANVVADRIELSCGCAACCEDEGNAERIRSLSVEE